MTEPSHPDESTSTVASDPQTLKAVERADVYKAGRLAAHLTRLDDGRIAFEYTSAWVQEAGPPVASTLPVGEQPVVSTGGAVPAFFAGLLPEGRRFQALRRAVKTSEDDELTLLLGIGTDTIGDVQVVVHGVHPDRLPPRLSISSFGDVRFADLLSEMDVRVDRVGLPGVQEKVSAATLNLPLTAAGSQTLLKLSSAAYPHIVENEDYFIGAAGRAGIPVVDAALVHDLDGESGLAVTRFDRVATEDGPRTLAVEDGCQVLGLPPSSKYLVGTARLLSALTAVCEARVPAAAAFLAQVAFAYLSGNGDAHAKNFSVLQDAAGRWQPAPAYDLPCTWFYGDTTMALHIEGRIDDGITGEQVVALGGRLGVRPRAARTIVSRVAASADQWLDGIDGLPFDEDHLGEVKREIARRQQLLRVVG